MPIFLRLFLAFALAAIIPAIVIIVLGSFFLNTLTVHGQAMQVANQATTISMQAMSDLERMNALLGEYHSTLYANEGPYGLNNSAMARMATSAETEILDLEHSFGNELSTYQQNFLLGSSPNMDSVRRSLPGDINAQASNQAQIFRTASQQWSDYKQAQDAELTALKANLPHSQTHSLLEQANARYASLLKSWQQLVTVTQTISNEVTTIGSNQIGMITLGTVIAILATAMVVITIGYIINLTITRPLRQLANLTKRISKGDTTARVKINSRDEIYIVANSMNNMLDNIVRLIQETQAQRDNLQAQVEKLVSEVSGVGEGDLRVQAEVTADALGVLADSFNYMVEELGNLVIRVKTVAREVEQTTSQLIDGMTQLVEEDDMQLRQISEAAVEVEQMAEASRRVAERAQLLHNVAVEARKDAQGGREAVEMAIAGMGRIHENVQATAKKVQVLGDRSREINNIVEAISSIAHQTNRLALDAAIQAAMAGEHGKGFGAVAADIRRLAERAKEQASNVTRIVRSVREDIGAVAVAMQDTERETEAGARLTQEAGGALETVFTVIEQQAREIETINQMANQQLESSSSVVQIMHSVSEATQRSSTTTREAAQAMGRLARLVERLRASVEAFKLNEDQSYLSTTGFTDALTAQDSGESQSLSGAFRTVTATAQAQPTPTHAGLYNALPPARQPSAGPTPGSEGFSSFQPLSPSPSPMGNNEWSQSLPSMPASGSPQPGWPFSPPPSGFPSAPARAVPFEQSPYDPWNSGMPGNGSGRP
ncbi:methyl-accepting chemotaxis protein [Thermogemmatispora sp.]|uniref:methyl-accepting chemotaxis protein n=1 Tax=Thermogemmatispora sp. TaxID=1968838 RepID=UPI0035E442C3